MLRRRGFRQLGFQILVQRRGSASVEFAMSGIALFGFLLVIVNIGYLGLTLGVLQRGVEGAARQAATVAAANLGGLNAGNTACPTSGAIQGYFANFTSPVINQNSVTLNYGAGTSAAPWITNDGNIPSSYITLTANDLWKPIGLGALLSGGLSLNLTAAAFVMGTGTTTC